ncbi:hypothetical protein ACS5PN_04420 [Roseateles sp. NT4]|uniref:hypothetical protein n=1 Tax=Roseateles sp. NT4 TaxID=3453715 RepID=UPI003EE93D69
MGAGLRRALSVLCLAVSLPAAAATVASPLDLRLPPMTARGSPPAGVIHAPSRPVLRLEPRKTLIERGVEGSREALLACQRGAYPGATVTASGVQVSGGDAQPDHCYRF